MADVVNWDLVNTASAEVAEHVQEEFERIQTLAGALERGLELAIRAYTGQAELPGEPPEHDAPMTEWLDYFVSQGMIVYHSALFDQVPA